VRGSESRNGHHPVDIDAFGDEGLADGQLIGCERTGLVGAENIDTLRTRGLALARCFDQVNGLNLCGKPGAGSAPSSKSKSKSASRM
jgi:hypothetical protein